MDSQGNLAGSEQTGFFDTNATSFWTTAGDSPDGDETAKGGAARLFGGGDIATAQTRKIYTNFSGEDLTATANAVVPTNNNLTNTLLGLTGATGEPTRTELLQWLSGIDIKDEDSDGSSTDPRRVMGDPLHTQAHFAGVCASTYASKSEPCIGHHCVHDHQRRSVTCD